MSLRRIILASMLLTGAPVALATLNGCDTSLPAFAVPPDFDAGLDAAADEDAGAEDDPERDR
jgi:hypothetical protein